MPLQSELALTLRKQEVQRRLENLFGFSRRDDDRVLLFPALGQQRAKPWLKLLEHDFTGLPNVRRFDPGRIVDAPLLQNKFPQKEGKKHLPHVCSGCQRSLALLGSLMVVLFALLCLWPVFVFCLHVHGCEQRVASSLHCLARGKRNQTGQ